MEIQKGQQKNAKIKDLLYGDFVATFWVNNNPYLSVSSKFWIGCSYTGFCSNVVEKMIFFEYVAFL